MTKPLKIEGSTGNVFEDIGFAAEEAHNLLLRADLMLKIERFVKQSGMTQKEAARVLGVTQPPLNQLLKRKIELFSLDALVNMLSRAGMRVKMRENDCQEGCLITCSVETAKVLEFPAARAEYERTKRWKYASTFTIPRPDCSTGAAVAGAISTKR